MTKRSTYEVVNVGGCPLGVGKVLNSRHATTMHEMLCNAVFGKETPADLKRMKAHCARIAACLNFCEGYSNDTLENGLSLSELIEGYMPVE